MNDEGLQRPLSAMERTSNADETDQNDEEIYSNFQVVDNHQHSTNQHTSSHTLRRRNHRAVLPTLNSSTRLFLSLVTICCVFSAVEAARPAKSQHEALQNIQDSHPHDVIEDVNKKQLEQLIKDKEFVAVFFCKYSSSFSQTHNGSRCNAQREFFLRKGTAGKPSFRAVVGFFLKKVSRGV